MGNLVALCTPVQAIRLALRQSGFAPLSQFNKAPLITSFQQAVFAGTVTRLDSQDQDMLRAVCTAKDSVNALWRIKDKTLDLACFTESCFGATFIRTGDIAGAYYALTFDQDATGRAWFCAESAHANLKDMPQDYSMRFCGTLAQMKENYIKTKRLAPSRGATSHQVRKGKLIAFPVRKS